MIGRAVRWALRGFFRGLRAAYKAALWVIGVRP